MPYGSWLKSFSWIMVMLVTVSNAFASGSSGVTYHGRLLRPDGSPLQSQSVQFKMQLRTPGNESCVLYEELQTLDMRNSSGVFAISINDGSGTRTDKTGLVIDQVFQNRGSFNLDSATCVSGSGGPTTAWTPNVSDGRKLQVLFRDETMAQWEAIPSTVVNFVPMAIEAKQVGGFRPANLLRVDDSAVSLNANPMTLAQLTELQALIAGTSQQYMKTSGAGGGALLPVLASPPTSPAAGTIWYDSSSGDIMYYNGTATQTLGTGGGSGTVTSITAGTGLSGGTITTSGTISMPNVGTAGTYYKVTTDAQGRVASGAASLIESDIPALSSAGKVSGGAVSGSINVGAGNTVTATYLSSTTDSTQSLRIFEPTNTHKVTLSVPGGLTADWNFILPLTAGTANQVLTTDGAGNLSWTTPAAGGGVTSVSGTAPISVANNATTPLISISQANGTTDGYLSSADWNTFNGKLGASLASGKIYVGNGSNVATAVTPSGDVTVTTAGGFTVTHVQGITVSAAAPTTAGQVLRYDGSSSYVPASLGVGDITGLSTALTNKIDASQMPANCAANQTLTFSSPTGAWTCASISITGSAFGSQAANLVLAAPNGSAGNPAFRALVAADIPSLDASKITSGALPVANGGTGTTDGSITGTGALTFAAGGTNQNVTLAPSGSGASVLNGNVGIGTTTPGVSLDISAKTDAIALPKGTTAEQPASPVSGWIRYNTSNNLVEFYNGAAWTSFSTGSGITALTGDVTASGAGSVNATVTKVNGVVYPASPSTNTVPVVTGANTITYQAVPNAALANSSVTLGSTSVSLGATATSIAGLTSVGLGVNGATTGQVTFANGGASGAAVTVQNNAATTAYNFNLPADAGTAGYALTSGGGGASPMTWTAIAPATGSSSITTVGTVTSGTWNATVISPSYGGTGVANPTAHGVMLGEGSSNMVSLTSSAAGQILQGNGAAADPTFTAAPVLGVNGTTTGTIGLANSAGGGATTTIAPNAATTSAYTFTLPPNGGTNGYVLQTDGNGSTSWAAAASGSGTVNSGTQNQLAWYGANGSAVNGLATAANGVLVTDGSGVPSISSTLPLSAQSNITQTGTITSGTWNGSVIGAQYGGTGLNASAAANGQLLIGNGAGFTLAGLTGTANRVSVTNGAGSITLSAPQDIHSGASPTFTGLTLSGLSDGLVKSTSGVLSGGNTVSLTADVGGVLPSANGGTGFSTYTTGDMIYASGANTLAKLPAGTNGHVLTLTGGVPTWAAGASSTPALSSLSAATATNTIDNANFAQTWNWSTASTQNPLALTADALTTGSLLNLTTSSASLNSSGGLLNVANTGASTNGVLARFQANSTAGSGMTILANGNVGIGTASPTGSGQRVLQIAGTADAIGNYGSLSLSGGNGGNWYAGAIDFYGAAVQVSQIRPIMTGGGNTADLTFSVASGGALSEKARLIADGTFRVGTATGGSTGNLYVYNNQPSTTATGLTLNNYSTTNGSNIKISLASSDLSGGLREVSSISSVKTGTAAANVTGDLSFNTTNAGTSAEVMRLSSSGNVGIGTTTPGVSLDISAKTDAIALPKGTTAQQPASPVSGWIRYNTSNNLVEYYNGSAWTSLAAAGSGITALTGDVTATGPGSATATVVKVNGVSYPASPSTNTVPVVTGANTITYQAVPNAALANSSVTLGSTSVSLGATATSIAGLTSVGLGVNGTTTGQVTLANGNASGASVTVQNNSATAAYNFNLPATAGTSGQVLASGGGAAAPMTWTTLATSATTDATNASNISSGTLDVARLPTVTVPYGGTGLTSVATNSLLYGNGTGNMNALAPVNSAVLTTTAGGVPQWSTVASDTFTQYALLAGRAGGQALKGGTLASENLTLDSTANATKGNILLAPSGGNVGVGTTSPGAKLEIASDTANVSGLKFTNFTSAAPTTAGQPVGVDASGNLVTISVSGSGTVNSGTQNQLAWYGANGSAVNGLATAANGVLVTDGSGVPSIGSTLPLSAQSNITQTGTITSGTWNGSVIGAQYGGTGLNASAAANGQLLIGNGAGFTLAGLTGTANRVSVTNGAGSITLSAPQDIHSGASPTFTGLTLSGLSNGFVKSTSGVLSGGNSIDLTADVGGVLPVANGGTNINTYATGDMLYASAANTLSKLPAGTNGHVLTLAGGVPTWSAGASGTPALSALTAAGAVNTIDNLNFAQTWNWSTATTQNPLSISGNALTTGSLLNLTTSNNSVNSTGGLLNVTNSGTSTNGVLARFQSNSTAGSGMTILTNGNVGIGTTSPSSRMHIAGGDVRVEGAASNNANVWIKDGTLGQLWATVATTSGYYSVWDSNNAKTPFQIESNTPDSTVVVRNTGRVGIGTTTPGVSLDLSAKTDAIALPKGTTAQQPGSPVSGWIRYNTSNNAVEFYNGSAWTTLAAAGGSYLSTSGGTLSGALTISSGGASITGGLNNNSGGITSAGSITGVGASITGSGAMTVAAGGTAQNLTLSSSTTGSVNIGSGNGTSLSVLDGGASTVNYVTVKGAAAGASPTIATAGSDANINLTLTPKGTGNTIISTGNVGMGTTSPGAQLSLGSTANMDRFYLYDSGAGGAYGMGISANTLNLYANAGAGANATIALGKYDKTTFTEWMRVQNGSVGIGTTATAGKLEVKGGKTYLANTTAAADVIWSHASLIARDDRTFDQYVGGGITFEGQYNSSAAYSTYGWIRGFKSTATDGDFKGGLVVATRNGDMVFQTKSASGTIDDLATGTSMVINASGNVGIGTTAPQNILHINGNSAYVQYTNSTTGAGSSTTGTAVGLYPATGDFTFWNYYNGAIFFGTNNNERLRITNSGNVGIGTTTPGVSLDLSAKTDAIALPKGTTAQQPGSPVAGWIRYNTSNNAVEFYNGSAWTTLSTGGGSYLSTSGGTLSGALTISSGGASVTGGLNNNSGNITNAGSITGVGANITGSGAMTVAAGGAAQNLTLSSSTTGSVNVGSGNGTSLSVLDGGASTVNYVTVKGAAAGSSPTIATAGSDANINLTFTPKGTGKTIFSSGNVGVGTTNPQVKQHIYDSTTGGSTTRPVLRLENNDNNYGNGPSLVFNNNWNGSTPNWRLAEIGAVTTGVGNGNGGSITFSTHDSGGTADATVSERMRIDYTGKVGIGTTSPANRLDIYQNVGGSVPTDTVSIYTQSSTGVGNAGNATINLGYTNGANSRSMRLGIGDPSFGHPDSGFIQMGVGTIVQNTSGAYKLSDNGTATFGGLQSKGYEFYSSSADNQDAFTFYSANTSQTAATIKVNSARNTSNGTYKLIYATSAGGAQFVVQDGGNVGIGTTTPGARLEVSSGVADTSGLKFTNFTSSAPTGTGQPVGVDASGNLITISVSGSGTVNSGTAGQMAFYNATGSAVNGNANATISNGALTLGQTGTIGKLSLAGNTSGAVTIAPQAAAGTYNFNLPTTAGTSGQVLTSAAGGASAMTWTTLATSATTDATNASNISSGTLNAARLPTVPIASGGTGQTTASAGFNALSPVTTLGDIIYGNGANSSTRLAGNTTTTKRYLSQTGTGAASAAPVWSQPAFSELSGSVALGSQVSGTLPVGNGGTGLTSGTSGGVPYFSGSTTIASSGVLNQYRVVLGGGAGAAPTVVSSTGTAGQVLTSNGSSSAPTWQTPTSAAGGSDGQIQFNSSGSLSGSASLAWDNSNGRLGIGLSSPAGKLHIGGSAVDLTGSGTPSASESYSGNPAADAFDNDTSTTGWGSNATLPVQLQYDFGSAQVVTSYSLYRSSSQSGGWASNVYSPTAWTFQGSNNGSSWTTLDTRSGQLIAIDAAKTTYSFSNSTGYRYYRLNFSASNGGGYVSITEMEMMGSLTSLMVADSGNVGIGTTSPSSPLTVSGVIESKSGGIKFPDGTTQTTAAASSRGLVVLTSGTAWTVPAGVTTIKVTAIGGGGSGGCGSWSSGGGGGGGVSQSVITGLTPLSSISLSIGSGGSACTAGSNNAGNAGGTTSFGPAGGVTLTANGGGGGTANGSNGGMSASASGGTASGGTVNATGQKGSGSAAYYIQHGGAGGSTWSSYGIGGAAVMGTNSTAANGSPGTGYGGGGGGGAQGGTAGSGAAGAVIIEY